MKRKRLHRNLKKRLFLIVYFLAILVLVILLLSLPRSCSKSETNYAAVGGCVNDPGVYPIYKGMTLYELIRKADGIKENADMSKFDPDMEVIPFETYCIPCRIETKTKVKVIVPDIAPTKRDLPIIMDSEHFSIIYAGLPRTFILIDVYPQLNQIFTSHIPWFTAVHDLSGGMKTIFEMYLIGGTPSLVRATSEITNQKIDYYFAQDRPAWINFINYLGGVKVDIPPDFAREYKVNSGTHIIDGYTSWFYITYISKEMRKIDNRTGSLNRITRQKYFMKELFKKFSDLDFFSSGKIGKAILEEAETNITIPVATELSLKVRKMKKQNFELFTYPGIFMDYNKERYWEVNPDKYKHKIFEQLNRQE